MCIKTKLDEVSRQHAFLSRKNLNKVLNNLDNHPKCFNQFEKQLKHFKLKGSSLRFFRRMRTHGNILHEQRLFIGHSGLPSRSREYSLIDFAPEKRWCIQETHLINLVACPSPLGKPRGAAHRWSTRVPPR